jgi:hypothetical protein
VHGTGQLPSQRTFRLRSHHLPWTQWDCLQAGLERRPITSHEVRSVQWVSIRRGWWCELSSERAVRQTHLYGEVFDNHNVKDVECCIVCKEPWFGSRARRSGRRFCWHSNAGENPRLWLDQNSSPCASHRDLQTSGQEIFRSVTVKFDSIKGFVRQKRSLRASLVWLPTFDMWQ